MNSATAAVTVAGRADPVSVELCATATFTSAARQSADAAATANFT